MRTLCSLADYAILRTMVIGMLELTLHLPQSHSLKDKRQVLTSLLPRLRQRFAVAIAEVEEQDRWQLARLGVSYVSNSHQHISKVLEQVRRFVEETRPDVIIVGAEMDMIDW
jgi:uncharacterized protein YlxP (DUF503 family)